MGSLIINAILLLFLMIPYFIRSLSLGFNKYINIVDTIPTIKSFFYSQIGTPCWDWLSNVGRGYPAWWDHQIFTGAIATLSLVFLIIFMIRKYYTDKSYLKSNETITLLVIAAIFTFALFTRFRGFSLYYLIHFIPGMSSMRSLTRIINIELLFFAIAGAFTFSKIIKQKKIWAAPVFILCLGLFVVDNYNNSPYHTPVEETQKRVNALTARMVHIPKGSIMSYEPTNKEGSATSSLQIDAMLAAQTLNLKTVNGYSATSAKGYGDFWFNLDSASRVKYFSEAGYTPDTVYVVK
jgi:hypothetical protein